MPENQVQNTQHCICHLVNYLHIQNLTVCSAHASHGSRSSVSPCFSCTGLTGTCHGGPRDFSQDFSSLRRPQQTAAPSSYPLTHHVPYYGTLQHHTRPSKITHPQISVNQIAGNNNPQTPPPLPLRRTATTHGSMMPKMSMVPHSHSQYYPPMYEQVQHSQEAPSRPGTH